MLNQTILLKRLLILILSTALFAYGFLQWLFYQPESLAKDTWLYHLAITQPAKDFPIWNSHSTPHYSQSIQDGLSPASTQIQYTSHYSLQALHQLIIDKEYQFIQQTHSTNYYEKQTSKGSIQITLSPNTTIKIYFPWI